MSTDQIPDQPDVVFDPILPPNREPFCLALPIRLLKSLQQACGPNPATLQQLAREREFSESLAQDDRQVGQRHYFGAEEDQPIPYGYFARSHWCAPGARRGVSGIDMDLFLSLNPQLNRHRVERSLGIADDRIEKFSEIARGYLGWLLTSPIFLAEHDQLLTAYRSEILEWELPQLSRPLVSRKPAENLVPITAEQNRFCEAFDAFFKRWRLRTLAAPGLPVPLTPQIPVPSTSLALGPQNEVGCLFFIPDTFPTLSRDLLRELLEDALRQNSGLPDHLQGWSELIDKGNSSKSEIARFARLFEIQHYLRIVRQRLPKIQQGVLERCLAELCAVSEAAIHADVVDLTKKLGRGWQDRGFGIGSVS